MFFKKKKNEPAETQALPAASAGVGQSLFAPTLNPTPSYIDFGLIEETPSSAYGDYSTQSPDQVQADFAASFGPNEDSWRTVEPVAPTFSEEGADAFNPALKPELSPAQSEESPNFLAQTFEDYVAPSVSAALPEAVVPLPWENVPEVASVLETPAGFEPVPNGFEPEAATSFHVPEPQGSDVFSFSPELPELPFEAAFPPSVPADQPSAWETPSPDPAADPFWGNLAEPSFSPGEQVPLAPGAMLDSVNQQLYPADPFASSGLNTQLLEDEQAFEEAAQFLFPETMTAPLDWSETASWEPHPEMPLPAEDQALEPLSLGVSYQANASGFNDLSVEEWNAPPGQEAFTSEWAAAPQSPAFSEPAFPAFDQPEPALGSINPLPAADPFFGNALPETSEISETAFSPATFPEVSPAQPELLDSMESNPAFSDELFSFESETAFDEGLPVLELAAEPGAFAVSDEDYQKEAVWPVSLPDESIFSEHPVDWEAAALETEALLGAPAPHPEWAYSASESLSPVEAIESTSQAYTPPDWPASPSQANEFALPEPAAQVPFESSVMPLWETAPAEDPFWGTGPFLPDYSEAPKLETLLSAEAETPLASSSFAFQLDEPSGLQAADAPAAYAADLSFSAPAASPVSSDESFYAAAFKIDEYGELVPDYGDEPICLPSVQILPATSALGIAEQAPFPSASGWPALEQAALVTKEAPFGNASEIVADEPSALSFVSYGQAEEAPAQSPSLTLPEEPTLSASDASIPSAEELAQPDDSDLSSQWFASPLPAEPIAPKAPEAAAAAMMSGNLEVLAVCPLTAEKRMLLVHDPQGAFALMGQSGMETPQIFVLKIFEQNPLAYQNTFTAVEEASTGGQGMFIVQVGSWHAIISTFQDQITLHTELG